MKLRPVVIAVVVAFVTATFASAQSPVEALPPSNSSVQPITRPALRIPITVWASGVAADQVTTYWFASRYRDVVHEQNPLIRPLDRHPLLLIAAGTAIDAGSGWLAFRVLGPRHPKIAKAVFYGAAAYRTFLAVHNVRMMQSAGELRASAAGSR